MTPDTSSQKFFEALYIANPDPWNFTASAYETSRYETVVRELVGRRYLRAFEPGCSIGVLTSRLGKMCESVEAIDISPSAVESARSRCRDLPGVHISQGEIPEDVPAGMFDLIVLSEIAYYFEPAALEETTGELGRHLAPGGTLLGVHWLGRSADHKLSGEEAHALIDRTPGLRRVLSVIHGTPGEQGFLLDRWERV